MKLLQKTIAESISIKDLILKDCLLQERIEKATEIMTDCLAKGHKIFFCGNGGSAADAQHLAAELSGRFAFDRPPLNAEALHCNTSYLTAVANDYGYNEVYSRLIRASGKANDILVGLTTSGNSTNIVSAFNTAKELKMKTIALTGATGGLLSNPNLTDLLLNVPSLKTPRIQELHILIGHLLCEVIEVNLFADLKPTNE